MGPYTNLVVNFPLLVCALRVDALSKWENTIFSPTCGMKTMVAEKNKWNPIECPLLKKIVDQGQYCIAILEGL
jgi:hypothetical protein